ncbi:GrpB family protein [Neorhodopirellula pilleata]|uniref:Dephospho-CoA kinase/protein folding accessory domain-containing protein n=1 Tax=Neorhodopirellula pilleata TaxID=2714738 RepID=A0A5C6AWI1_9BACT|nr:GrpB family protein [Neorhodopirellula pilleata]TWU03988.1 dephospho-CoA kinase/protein folding accessory domain-containing protein [Neorhodopirellula pilleata]
MNPGQWLDGCDNDDPDRIRLMYHDPRWRQEFEQTRSSILQSCDGRVVAVEHIGSTAISGLIARPIIDAVAVVADPVDLSDAAMLIEGLNFRETDQPDWVGELCGTVPVRLLEKPRHGETTHRVYVVSQGSRLLGQSVRLREHFRSSPEAAIDFESQKVEVWKRIIGEPARYHAAMNEEFQRRLLRLE